MSLIPNKVYHCPTLEDAEAFLNECNKQGIAWCDGAEVSSEEPNYDDYEGSTCYFLEQHSDGSITMTYGSLEYAESDENTLEIIKYSPISTEASEALDAEWKNLMQIS